MRPKTRLGCGYLLVSVLLTCVLLVINGLIVSNLFYASMPAMPGLFARPRTGQAALFLGPVLLLLVEWWICDVVLDWLRPLQRPAKKG